jgi:mono/diheme cytochrome c family protein
MRYFNLAVLLVVIAVVAMAGFRGHHFRGTPFELFPDMNYQPKVKDQQPSNFFADGMASRPPVPGTIAEEMPAVIDYWASGKYDASHWGDGIPVHAARDGDRALEVSDADMARGRERYSINCAVCHGAAGDGKGITSQYGINATSYQSDRIRTMNDGEIFNTITNGKGQMMGYGYNIAIDDRWRIIEYIRALQHCQNATLQDASPQEQQDLNKTKKPSTTRLLHHELRFRPFAITYLGKDTVAFWYDSNDMPFGGSVIGATYAAPFTSHAKTSDSASITYLNQQTMHGWKDTEDFAGPGGHYAAHKQPPGLDHDEPRLDHDSSEGAKK